MVGVGLCISPLLVTRFQNLPLGSAGSSIQPTLSSNIIGLGPVLISHCNLWPLLAFAIDCRTSFSISLVAANLFLVAVIRRTSLASKVLDLAGFKETLPPEFTCFWEISALVT